MHDEAHNGPSAPPSGDHDEVLAVVHDEHIARCIEAALLPIRSRLSPAQLEIVRAVLCSSIETDPVSRLLAKNAVEAHAAGTTRPVLCCRCEDEAAGPSALDRNYEITK